MKSLELITPLLKYAEYPFKYEPLPSGQGQQIVVGPRAYFSPEGKFDKQRPLFLFINSRNLLLSNAEDEKRDYLELLVQHPSFQMNLPNRKDVLALLRNYHLVLPFGKYFLTPDNALLYRYSCSIETAVFEGVVFLEVLDTLWYFYDQLTRRIEAVAANLSPLSEILAESLLLEQGIPDTMLKDAPTLLTS